MGRKEVEAITIKDQVYEILKAEIMNGTIAPGEKLNEQHLADRLRVSRSPVREAIKQLAGNGLVDNIPNKGAFVKILSEKELSDIYSVRLMFEMYAAEHAFENIQATHMQQLRRFREGLLQAYGDKNMQKYLEYDFKLHNLLVKLGANDIVTALYDNIYAQLNNFRTLSLTSGARFVESINEHVGIIDALLEGNQERLKQLIRDHLMLAMEVNRYHIEEPHRRTGPGDSRY